MNSSESIKSLNSKTARFAQITPVIEFLAIAVAPCLASNHGHFSRKDKAAAILTKEHKRFGAIKGN